MTERKYTLSEIDAMRKSLLDLCEDNGRMISTNGPPYPKHSEVEDRLRTYMMAGIEPKELREKADSHLGWISTFRW